MAGNSKKQGSLIGTIITIIVIITFINTFTASNMNIRVGNFIMPLIIFIIVIYRLVSVAGKSSKQEKSDFSTRKTDSRYNFAESAKSVLGEIEKAVENNDSKSRAKKVSKYKKPAVQRKDNDQIIEIDEKNHYAIQYKELYESGILTKEEFRERINKLNK
jgi:hypothetical protein